MDAATSSEAAPLSKRALKRLAREEKLREQRKQRRITKKQEAKSAEPFQEVKWDPLPHEPLNPTRQEKKVLQQQAMSKCQSSISIAIDCSFEKYMTESEKKSMHQQIAYSYASNRDAPVPYKLAVCGLEPFLKERLDKMKAGTTWGPWGATLTTNPVESSFPRDQLVYLSADSDTVLDRLEEGKVYIIGGIVDRNRHKGLCENKAKSLGIPTAKFPLEAYFAKAGFSRVLTTNHCVDILLEFACSEDWMQACKRGVPVRKLKGKRRRGKGNQDEDDAGSEPSEPEPDKNDAESTNEQESQSAQIADIKLRHALIIGSTSSKSAEACEYLVQNGWSVLIATADFRQALDLIKGIRQKHESLSGEMAVAPLDCSQDGDLLRVKEIVFKRFERILHTVIFTDDRQDERPLLARTMFVRDCFRVWTGPNRTVPKFLIADAGGPKDTQMQEWINAFVTRLPEDSLKQVSESFSLEDGLKLVNSALVPTASSGEHSEGEESGAE